MHDAELVRAAETDQHLPRDHQRARRRHRAVVQRVRQQRPLQELHHEEQPAARQLARVDDGGDVGVIDALGGGHLAMEARRELLDLRLVGRQHLDGDVGLLAQVLAAIDGAQPAGAEHFTDEIAVGDQLADEIAAWDGSAHRDWTV